MITDTITREQALQNLPTNDEGENFCGELLADVELLKVVEAGDETSVTAQIAKNPWLTRETIIQQLRHSKQTLLTAGFTL